MEDSMKPTNDSSQAMKSNRYDKQAMTSRRQTQSKGGKGQNQSLVEDTGFVGPVPVAVTTVRLVREAEI